MIDGNGGVPLENSIIVIEGSKIKDVGKDLEIPEGAGVIDATGKTVMPGLIDSHVHNGGGVSNNWNTEMVFRPRELRLIKAIYDAKDLLASGFTMVTSDRAFPSSSRSIRPMPPAITTMPRRSYSVSIFASACG